MTNREAIKVLEWIKNTHPEHITCEAIDIAVSALEKQEADRWISVTERLPEKSDGYRVTAYELGSKMVFNLYYSTEHGWDGWWNGKVIAWKPIEEPYTEEENDKP